MNQLPNYLSALRFPLALLFLQQGVLLRTVAIFLAMMTDVLDGFLARRYQFNSRLGATLDPLADKFFVIFALVVYIGENRLSFFEACTFISRDIAVVLFGCYLVITGKLAQYQIRSIYSGKITTSLQFIVLLSLTFDIPVPKYVYTLFIALGLLALVELYINRTRAPS